MASDEERRSLDLEKPDMPAKKKTQMRIIESRGVGGLVVWGGALAFACLLAASTFKKNKRRSSGKRTQDAGGSDPPGSGFREHKGCENEAGEMKGLRFLLQPSTDRTSTSSSVRRFLKEDEKMLTIYEEEHSDSEKFEEYDDMLEDDGSSEDEASWLEEWMDRSSREVEETSSLAEDLLKKSISIEGDDKTIEIILT